MEIYYVEKKVKFSEVDWEVVDCLEKAKTFKNYRLASIQDLIRYYYMTKISYNDVLVKEGIATFNDKKKEYTVKRTRKLGKKLKKHPH